MHDSFCVHVYTALMEELRETTKPKKSFALFSKSQEAVQQEREASLSFKVHRRLQQNAAKILLIEEAVHTVKLEAREEYRKAHPCKFVCDVCQAAFADAAVLRSHTKDQVLHRDLARQKVLCEEKFACVESIFKGHQGRHLRANRLIHSSELGSLQTRIDVAVEDPFRPNIADVGGKRYAQQMKGSMVTGFDAKAGIRPMHKRYGLIRQHLAPMRQKANANSLFQVPQPQLQEVLHHLLRCKDDFIDTVSTCDNPINIAANAAKIDYEPLTDRTKLALDKEGETGDGEEVFTKNNNSHGMCAIVRFQWNMFANNQVFIIGEFTGWKKQEMVCSSKSNKFTIYKQLSPGRYRYRFVIDGVECVDEVASKVPDPKGPGGFTNEVLVTNTPLYHQHQHSKHGVPSPLEHMTRQHSMKKLGLVLPPSAELTSSSAKSLRSPGFGRLSSAASADSVQSEATNESDESDAHSVGEIIHISKHDKEGLIRHLKHIELRNLSLYDDGTWTLASYINRNAFIQMIDLSYNYISDDGIQGFSGCLPLLDALTTLKLNGNGFSMDGCRYLTQNLAASTTLTTLEIANNRIGDDGMEVICAFLKHNEHLQHLYVDTCLIGDDGLECLHDALLFNRRLRSISLMSNRFTVKGIRLLAKALHFNAALESLNVSHNPIGPEAANSIGSCLIVNDTLTSLELANIDLLAHHSSFGVHGICAGIKVNKTLTRLNLKNNKLEDMHAVDIAHVYMNNNVLVDIDLSGNTITAPWFKDYTYIPTHVLPEMPSIETLRHRNVIYARSHVNTFDESKSRYLDDVPRGKWTFRRQWKREIQSQHEKDEIERKFAAEQTRIDAENAYIRFHLADIMITVKEYLEQEPCKAYMKLLTKAIQQFIFDLGRFDSKQYNRFNMSIVDIPVIKGKNNVRAATIKLKRQASGTIPTSPSQQSRGSSPSRESARPLSPLKLTNITSLSVRPQKLEQNNFNMEHFLNAHISIIYAVFSILNGKTDGGSSSLMISPLLLQQAFHFLALPLKLDQVQGAVDATLIKAFSAIGMHRFSDYVLSNAQRLCRESKLQRMRILADLMFNPPGQEARAIIYDHLHHATFNELRDKYRSMAENAPLFACPECHKRFIKQKHLDKHMSKGASSGEHRRYRMKEVIHHSQVLFLQDIKHQLTDVFFPAYYELKPGGQLPKHYYPQVFDKIGSEGRPFGVVEANRTIRVLDVFGEYLHVVLHGEVGWVRYRKEKEFYLQPTCAGQDGFDWDKLHVQEIATYYRGEHHIIYELAPLHYDEPSLSADTLLSLNAIVNDLLPKETELKVRYTPKPDAEVLGYLQRGQVIECLAVIGDWLQVRYGKEDTAWVRWRITTPQSRAAQAVEAVLAASEAAAAASDAASASASGKRTSTTRRISFNPVETFRSFSAPLLGFGDSGSLAGGASVMSGATQRSDTTGVLPFSSTPTFCMIVLGIIVCCCLYG